MKSWTKLGRIGRRDANASVVLATLFGLLAAVGLGGCTRQALTLESISGHTTLEVVYPTRALAGEDQSTADFYLTDLPPELWRPDADLSGVSGTLVHLHLFLPPAAGRAPMGENASNLNIRYVVLSRGEVGVYAGGGFLYLRGEPLGKSAGGHFSAASMRLVRATANFRDILGPAHLSGSFDAARQAEAAQVLAAKLVQVMEMAKKVE